MTQFKLYRKKSSYKYKRDMKAPDSWEVSRNDLNNLRDIFVLEDLHGVVWKAQVQSVANCPGARFENTVAPGKFNIRWDGDRRLYNCSVHLITDAIDMEGQPIDENAIQPVVGKNGQPIDLARTLVHDTQKCKPAPAGVETRVAWSAGCFIGKPYAMRELFLIGTGLGFRPRDVIPGILIEID